MDRDTKKLSAYTLKLSDTDLINMKILCVTDQEFQFQYNLLDKAVKWAFENKESLMAIANQKSGTYKSYYISESTFYLNKLEVYWNCTPTRALHSAIRQYLKYREKDLTNTCHQEHLCRV